MLTHQITVDSSFDYLIKMVSAWFLTFKTIFPLCLINILWGDSLT